MFLGTVHNVTKEEDRELFISNSTIEELLHFLPTGLNRFSSKLAVVVLL